jgi:hypothetical protein
LLDRLPILIWAGSALLGWVAGQTIVRDDALGSLISGSGNSAEKLAWFAGGAGAVLVIVLGGFWRHWRLVVSRASPRGE